MIGPGGEPDVGPGETSDWVLQLQTRLHGVGCYDGALDGHYGPATESAVSRLRTQSGAVGDGPVDAQTWELLAHAEAQHGGFAPDALVPAVGTVSEDAQWRWDGDGWQPNDVAGPVPALAPEASGGHLSADGQWVWDGSNWQAVIT